MSAPSLQQATERELQHSERTRVAYIVSRFPKLRETFILYELLSLHESGFEIQLYPLLRQREPVVHPDAIPLMQAAHYDAFVSWPILQAQLFFILFRPRRYLRALVSLIRLAAGSRNYLLGGLAIFPKVVHFARHMQSIGIEHVHCHFANHPATAGLLIHLLTDVPYSFTAHGSDLHVDRTGLCAKAAGAEFVIAVSKYNRDFITRECPKAAEKVFVIHCGVDIDTFRLRADASPNSTFHVLCVGALEEVKGQGVLIEACRRLLEMGIDVRCDLVGDGPDRTKLIAQIKAHGMGDRVVLLGPRPRDDVARLLQEADAFVLPSVPTRRGDREGIPVALMEAMSTGLPVVASELSGIPELVDDGHSGLLFPPGDAMALAGALARLQRDVSLRQALGRAARDRVVRDFDVRQNAEKLALLFTRDSAR